MVKKRGALALFSACFFAAILLAGSAGAASQTTKDLGKITEGSAIKINLTSVNDYAYVFYRKGTASFTNLVSAPNCAVDGTGAGVEQVAGYNPCPAICIQMSLPYNPDYFCTKHSKLLRLDNLVDLDPGNHSIRIYLLNTQGTGAVTSKILVNGVVEDTLSLPATVARPSGGMAALDYKTYNFEIVSNTCTGTLPSGEHATIGPAAYTLGYTPTSWVHDESATATTPCLWKCDIGYVANADNSGCISGVPVCGNWRVETGEQCDDGNTAASDGCNATCSVETGWSCVLNSTGSSVCKKQICAPASVNSTCIDFETKSTKTCELDEDTGIYNWSEAVETECGGTTFCDVASGQCIEEGQPPVTYCADYISENACSEDDAGVCTATVNDYLNDYVIDPENDGGYTEETLPNEGFCAGESPLLPAPLTSGTYAGCNYYVSDCACEWDDEEDSCGHRYTQEINCSGTIVATGTCTFTTAEVLNECSTKGQITYTRKAKWTGTAEALAGSCSNYVKTYKCAAATKLGFFGWWEFAFASCVIAVIYICRFYLTKKRER